MPSATSGRRERLSKRVRVASALLKIFCRLAGRRYGIAGIYEINVWGGKKKLILSRLCTAPKSTMLSLSKDQMRIGKAA
jgi:hypothetical protein